jgi:hypothetical protein
VQYQILKRVNQLSPILFGSDCLKGSRARVSKIIGNVRLRHVFGNDGRIPRQQSALPGSKNPNR